MRGIKAPFFLSFQLGILAYDKPPVKPKFSSPSLPAPQLYTITFSSALLIDAIEVYFLVHINFMS